MLDDYHIQRAIVNWYSVPLDVFQEMINRGMFLTIGVGVGRSDYIQALARELPLSQLLTKADNPGVLEWLTGERGMPRHLEAAMRRWSD